MFNVCFNNTRDKSLPKEKLLIHRHTYLLLHSLRHLGIFPQRGLLPRVERLVDGGTPISFTDNWNCHIPLQYR